MEILNGLLLALLILAGVLLFFRFFGKYLPGNMGRGCDGGG